MFIQLFPNQEALFEKHKAGQGESLIEPQSKKIIYSIQNYGVQENHEFISKYW